MCNMNYQDKLPNNKEEIKSLNFLGGNRKISKTKLKF